MLLAITPEEFGTVASSWIGALVVVIGAISAGLLVVLPKLTATAEQIKTLFAQDKAQKDRLDTQSDRIHDIALATPTKVTLITPEEPK